MAGTIPLSLTQQFDEFGKPLSGGLLYIMQAGTVSTPQQPYQDAALTIVMPNPIQLDAAGRVPQFFLADGYIKVRLQDKFGVVQLARDGILVIGPSAGGGGGGGVDPTTLIQTGMIAYYYGTGVLGGFVRGNARTIGSASSGATERANADCQALFQFLWTVDPNLAVTPSRGATAAADWAANKQLALPDMRGRVLAFMDDMGNVAAGRLTPSYFGNSALILGNWGGLESNTLDIARMPSHYHAAGIYDPQHLHNTAGPASEGTRVGLQGGGTYPNVPLGGLSTNWNSDSRSTGVRVNSSNGLDTTYSAGGGGAHANVQPTMLVTGYVKL